MNTPGQASSEDLPTPESMSVLQLMRDPMLPIPLHGFNNLSSGVKRRVYRLLIPPQLLTRFGIDPLSWRREGMELVTLIADAQSNHVRIVARHTEDAPDPFYRLELADNAFNGIDVVLVVLSDPDGPRFQTDYTADGQETQFGATHRNRSEEIRAMEAGLAPAQIRPGLRASAEVFAALDLFLAAAGHESVYMDPLTYADAWLFEKRGCSYVQGRRLMERIHDEFQPGGALHAALDSSTPFRLAGQWQTVRGRSWAIHDGILEAIGESWNNIRMVKRVGYDAGIQTFPDAVY